MEYKIKIQSNSSDLIISLNDFRNKDIHTDIIFQLNDEKIHAHRLVLASYSDYFNILLYSDKYKYTNSIIPIINTKPLIFKSFIEYIYGNSVFFDNWRDYLDFIKFLDYMIIKYFNIDNNIIHNININTIDYIEYINKLNDIYNGEIPINIIEHSAKFIKTYINLSEFSNEFTNIILNSEYYNPNNVAKIKIKHDLGIDINPLEVYSIITRNLYQEILKGNPIYVPITKKYKNIEKYSVDSYPHFESDDKKDTKLKIEELKNRNRWVESVDIGKLKMGEYGRYNFDIFEDMNLKIGDIIEIDDYLFYETQYPLETIPITLKDRFFVNVRRFTLLYKSKY